MSLIIALLITGTTYYFNTRSCIEARTDFALRLARQVAYQAETLMIRAHDRLESHPLDWAIQNLAVGPELRPVQIALFKINYTETQTEKYKFSSSTGVFNYLKLISPETNEGIKIHIQIGYVGLFGSNTLWQNDFWALILFLLVFALIFQIFRWIETRSSYQFEQTLILQPSTFRISIQSKTEK